LKATISVDKAKAYRELFEKVGHAGMPELMKDEDDGIALQAAWEFNKKAVKRTKAIPNETDDIYDRDELAKFLPFLKARTKASVPQWWGEAILDVDLFIAQHHAFGSRPINPVPKLSKSKAEIWVPEGAELEHDGDTMVYTSGSQKIKFPKNAFGEMLDDAMSGLLGEKRTVLISYTTLSGFPYKIAGFEGKGGEPSWKADVWAAGRTGLGGGEGHHWVELTAKDGSIFVFGAESHGMYMESFDIATGKVLCRFCTCYWDNCSEKWDLK
jgi:hypothetical protein